jgi:transcriptional regulator GlxA family with amidase domain
MTALQFIRRTNGQDVSVAAVVEQVSVSRRMLEKRFRGTVGRSILEDIHHVRLERCKRLLVETPYPVAKVARLGGFATTGYFIQFFLKRVGKTPRRYRMDLAG